MEISQSDRDKLRASQHKLNPEFVIGNIIEHKTQDPKRYKEQSRLEQSSDAETQTLDVPEKPKIIYKSKYFVKETISSLTSISEDLEPELPIKPKDVQANLWLNMDQVEFDKLEWMTDKADRIHQGQLEKTTLFDLEGRALPASSNLKDDSYDIQALVDILNSAYDSKVPIALSVITKIASLATMGYYDGAFDENIHDILIKSCLLRVRSHIDSTNETIRQNALKCMRSLLCNTRVDEIILDRIYPLISDDHDLNFWLETAEMESKQFTIEMKDIECVQVDAIMALISRTSILERFSYLLDMKTGGFTYTYYDCILDILIRMARHSTRVCSMLNTKELLSKVINLFLPSSITSATKQIRSLSVKALKLIRIIAQATKDLEDMQQKNSSGETIESKIPDDIVPAIEAYFSIDCHSLPPNLVDELFKLHIETLRTIKALCKLQRFRGDMVSLMALRRDKLFVITKGFASLSATKPLDSKISFDWQYAAHMIDLTGFFLQYEKYYLKKSFTEKIWSTYITPVLFQWLTDIIRIKSIPHLDVSITIAIAVHHYRNHSDDQGNKALIDIMTKSIITENLERRGNNMDLFKLLARTASEKSQLPGFLKESGRLRDPQGLPSYGCLSFNNSVEYKFKLSSLFDTDSPYILLNMFICQFQKEPLNNIDLKVFIDNIDLIRYIRTMIGYHKLPTSYELLVQESLVAQYEVQIISRSLLLLAQYYLNFATLDDEEGVIKYSRNELEPIELEQTRLECYGNLCYYTISTFGLLNTNAVYKVELKDQMFEKVLLNSKLQSRVSSENFMVNLDSRFFEDRNFLSGDKTVKKLEKNYLNVLIPIYLSTLQLDRFWMFQPILEYYYFHNRDCPGGSDTKGTQNHRWFEKNLIWRGHTVELAACNDTTVISMILEFNSIMMHYSPSYNHLVVRPNIEDCLCLVGSLFLDDDLFLDKEVSSAITCNLKTMLNQCIDSSKGDTISTPFKDASKIIKPLDMPLADFFNKLVDQFEAVSYGSIAFSNFLLLFISPKSDKMFRKKLFQEKTETCLSQLRMARDSLWAPKEIFFCEKERDPEIRALLTRSQTHILRGSFLHDYIKFHTCP